jgi:hypothetical protein
VPFYGLIAHLFLVLNNIPLFGCITAPFKFPSLQQLSLKLSKGEKT